MGTWAGCGLAVLVSHADFNCQALFPPQIAGLGGIKTPRPASPVSQVLSNRMSLLTRLIKTILVVGFILVDSIHCLTHGLSTVVD